MKKLYGILFIAVCFLSACHTLKKTEKTTVAPIAEQTTCPKQDVCQLEVIKNKTLHVLEDGIGMNYPKLVESASHDIIKYTYHKKTANGLVDGNYTETVFVVIPKTVNSLKLEGKELQQAKVLFGRWCYCKGNTGYFKITNGILLFEREKGKATLELVFKNHEVPQIINKVKGTFSF